MIFFEAVKHTSILQKLYVCDALPPLWHTHTHTHTLLSLLRVSKQK